MVFYHNVLRGVNTLAFQIQDRMGIPCAEMQFAGKQTLLPDGDIGAFNGGEVGLSAKVRVFTNVDLVVVIFHVEGHLIHINMMVDDDFVVIAVNDHDTIFYMYGIADDNLVVGTVAYNF
jgi:hypothetical protein